ncbi:MAG TPA: winged helix family transcriptional regulator [Flavobacteriaceae bacterium]|jgi:hypothetical protein|nr:winged helix family transcriptional regulator [Flavobacteriaceae bacterium]
MNRRTIYSLIALVIALFSVWILSDPKEKGEYFSERVKISLRDVGHQLLLSNQDSTSLVLPIIEIEKDKFLISFQNKLSFEPSNLVNIVKNSFEKSSLSMHYLVEVIQCSDKEIAYSYKIKLKKEKNIIPCRGRFLPENCYKIKVTFIEVQTFFNNKILLYGIPIIAYLLFQFFFYKKHEAINYKRQDENHTLLGSFKFYPEQNKLVKEAVEISLSKKECELLTIFIAKPNQVIKRDELMKRVWEDHGVFVGRSLDTYISKLRKKLKEDDSIKLTNVHGVGYKLEIH